ncbi:MAG TPA: hypothetical protein VGI81_22145 [Tepidisphaeraceae bacterium]|jgi:hypothetical protein
MSPTEYIQALSRQDQQRAEQERLERLLLEGLDSGTPRAVGDLDDYFAQKKRARR